MLCAESENPGISRLPASLREGRATGRLDHGMFFVILGPLTDKQIAKMSDSAQGQASPEIRGFAR